MMYGLHLIHATEVTEAEETPMNNSRILVIVIMLCACIIPACGSGKDQPVTEAEGAVRAAIPSRWEIVKVSISKFQPGPATSSRLATFSAELQPPEAFGLKVDEIAGTSVIREIMPSGQVVTLHGKLTAVQRGDAWHVEAHIESGLPGFAGEFTDIRPVSSFAPYVVEGSPQEAELLGRDERRVQEEIRREKRLETVRVEEELAAQLGRERVEVEARIQKQRIAREEVLKLMQPRMETIRNEHGLLLVPRDFTALWGTLLNVANADEEKFIFSGTGTDFSSLPPTEIEFSGRIDEQGQVHIELSHRAGTVLFDQLHAGGHLSGYKQQLNLAPLSEDQQKQIDARQQWLKSIAAVPVPDVKVHLHSSSEYPDVLNRRGYSFAAAEISVSDALVPPAESIRWFDESFNTSWRASARETVVRFRRPQSMSAIGLLVQSMNASTVTVNGSQRVLLPAIRTGMRRSEMIELSFAEPTEVYELRFDLPAGEITLYQIVILGKQ